MAVEVDWPAAVEVLEGRNHPVEEPRSYNPTAADLAEAGSWLPLEKHVKVNS